MSFKAHASLPQGTCILNPHALLARVDKALFDKYKAGLVLHVWRNSTPHNWWLASAGDRHDIVYHWPEREIPQLAYKAFGDLQPQSGAKVTYGGYLSAADAGLNVSDSWVFSQAKLDEALALWDKASACAETFNALAGSKAACFKTLCSFGRGLARRLKRGHYVPMTQESAPFVTELCSMGLAHVQAEGYAVATQALRDMRVPRESSLLAQAA